MKRSMSSRHWILFLVIILALVLVACERPLQEEIDEEPESAYPAMGDVDGVSVESQREPFLPLVTDLSGADGYPSPIGEGENAEDGSLGAEAAAPPGPEPLIYEVQSGDTLVTIALQYDVSIEDIASASGLLDVDILEVGQRLVIPIEEFLPEEAAAETPAEAPDASEVSLESAPEPDQPAAEEPTDQIHVVQTGDNLYRIGLLYGCSHQELATYNKMVNPDYLDVGDEVRIPNNCE